MHSEHLLHDLLTLFLALSQVKNWTETKTKTKKIKRGTSNSVLFSDFSSTKHMVDNKKH